MAARESEAVFLSKKTKGGTHMDHKAVVPVYVQFDEAQEKALTEKLTAIIGKMNEAKSLAGEVAFILENAKFSPVIGEAVGE